MQKNGVQLMSGASGMRVSRKALQLCRVGVAGMAIVLLAAVATLAHPGIVRAQELSELSGVWQGAELTPLGLSSVEVVFFPNGTYSRSHSLGTLMTYDSGQFEVVSNWVHFYLQKWAPTEYLGRPMTWPTSDTWIVTRFNGRILETASVHVVRVQ